MTVSKEVLQLVCNPPEERTPEQIELVVEAFHGSSPVEAFALWAILQRKIDFLFELHPYIEELMNRYALNANTSGSLDLQKKWLAEYKV